jgi:hypothetical protein
MLSGVGTNCGNWPQCYSLSTIEWSDSKKDLHFQNKDKKLRMYLCGVVKFFPGSPEVRQCQMWRAQFLKRIFLIIAISSIFISCGINLEAIQKQRTNSKLYEAKAALALHVQENYYAFSTLLLQLIFLFC